MNTAMKTVGTVFECPDCKNTVVVTGTVSEVSCRCSAEETVMFHHTNRPNGIPGSSKRSVPYGAVKQATLKVLRRRRVVTSVDIVEEFENLKPASVSCALHYLREEGVVKAIGKDGGAIRYRLVKKE